MYTRVESRFWQDEKMRVVSDDARYLMLYLLTSPHRNIMGFYFLPVPYACFDLGWDEERFNKALEELLSIDVIKYDVCTHVVLIQNYLKHNSLENPNQVTSAIDRLRDMPQTLLFKDFLEILQLFNKPFIQPLIELLKERLGQPVTVTVTGSVIDKETSELDAPTRPKEPPEDKRKPKKPKQKPIFEEDTDRYKLALFFRKCVLENLPNAKVPEPTPEGFKRWAYDIDLMIRIDCRSPDEIRQMIDWSHRDQFWKANILSPGKLREKWDTLTAHKKRAEEQVRGSPKKQFQPPQAQNFKQREYTQEFYKKVIGGSLQNAKAK